MKKKLIILLSARNLLQQDIFKYDLKKTDNNKIKIEFHSLQKFIFKNNLFTYKSKINFKRNLKFQDYKSWKNYFLKVIKEYGSNNIFVINKIVIFNFITLKINLFLKKMNIQSLSMSNNDQPVLRQISKINLILKIKKFFLSPKKFFVFFQLKFFNFIENYFNIYDEYFLSFGKASFRRHKKQKIIYGNSEEFNAFLNLKKKNYLKKIKKKYALFLESPTPMFDGDSKIIGGHKEHDFTIKNWYKSLNIFFDFLEKRLKIKVFIAPHPKSNHLTDKPNYYFGRKIIKKHIYYSSQNAKLIITRRSTGISYAVLNKIPTMFIFSNEILNNNISSVEQQNFFAKKLGKIPINIDNFNKSKVISNVFKINLNKYNKYKNSYLTCRKDNITNYDILENLINN